MHEGIRRRHPAKRDRAIDQTGVARIAQVGQRLRSIVACLMLLAGGASANAAEESPWLVDELDGERIVLYFFRTPTCPHCRAAQPFVAELRQRFPWLLVRDYDITRGREHIPIMQRLIEELEEPVRSVPAFVFCGELITGFDAPERIGAMLAGRLEACRARVLSGEPIVIQQARPLLEGLPFVDDPKHADWSLPMLTITLAALDSFNPCAMFVLLFLLSLMVHARSRSRMVLVGGIFVAISGITYFMLMAAWLNVFLLFGQLVWITLGAGIAAVIIGVIHVKDYFSMGQGISLSIDADAKSRLFRRMRALVGTDRIVPLVGGTVALAIVANAYELLCTAGFPMAFTRVLTLHDLSTTTYYAYLVLYNVIYVVPLFLLVLLFVATLGSRKLTAREGRTLKLLSGLMMLGLGLVLVVEPGLLSDVRAGVGILGGALIGTALIRWLLPLHLSGRTPEG